MIKVATIDDIDSIVSMCIDGAKEKGEDYCETEVGKTVIDHVKRSGAALNISADMPTGVLMWKSARCPLTGNTIFVKTVFYVKPEFRGSKAAIKLLMFAASAAKNINAKSIVFSGIIDRDYERLSSFYNKNGLVQNEVVFIGRL